MAYIQRQPRPGDEEETTAPITTGPAATPGALPSSAPTSSSPGKPAPASRFVAFSRYLNANGATASRAAEGLEGRVQSVASGALGKTNRLTTDFHKQAQAGGLTAPVGKEVVPDTTSRVVRSHGGIGLRLATTPNKPGEGQVSLAQADAYGQRTYTGPKGLESLAGYGDAYDTTRDATGRLHGLRTTGGVATQLGAGRTAGAAALDGSLVQRAGAGRFRELQSRYGNLSAYLGGEAAKAGKYAGEVAASTDRSAAAWRNAASVVRSAQAENAATAKAEYDAAVAEQARQAALFLERGREAQAMEDWKIEREKELEREREQARQDNPYAGANGPGMGSLNF